MVCHIMMEIGSTMSDRDLALVAIHLVMSMKACGIETGDMGWAQCSGLIAISRTPATGKTASR